MVWLNYFLIAQFAILCVGYGFKGDTFQSMYWFGALCCTAGVTFK